MLASLLEGHDPYAAASEQPAQRTGPTLDDGFRRFLAEGGLTERMGAAQRKRYEQTHRKVLAQFGTTKLATAITGTDLESYASRRQTAIKTASKDAEAGARQAEIEIRCIHRVLQWLADACGIPGIRTVPPKELLEGLKRAQSPERPRFTQGELAKIEHALPLADPRVRLLVTLQNAQRAGQLLRCWRSDVCIETTTDGTVTDLELDVPGVGKKRGGKFTPTRPAVTALLRQMESGYLKDLEQAYQSSGTDYPLFPGNLGQLAPRAIVVAGEYKPMDRSVARKFFLNLEAAAGVPHVAKRAFHGFRRNALDVLEDAEADPAAIQAAGNWSTIQVPMDIYRNGDTKKARKRAAALLERRAVTTQDTETRGKQAPEPQIEVVYPEAYPDLTQFLKAKNLTDAEVDEVLRLTKWAWVELNYRPHAYQACALTT